METDGVVMNGSYITRVAKAAAEISSAGDHDLCVSLLEAFQRLLPYWPGASRHRQDAVQILREGPQAGIYATNGFRLGRDEEAGRAMLVRTDCPPPGTAVVADLSALLTLDRIGALDESNDRRLEAPRQSPLFAERDREVRLGVAAPRHIPVHRSEVAEALGRGIPPTGTRPPPTVTHGSQ